ncbi:hypothetical protein NMY22_g12995 [Coprinellus aureogranulatus]|nr:hypothetical protein NMY22_g12995 [Coprinellus aureogranulatus]
MSETTKPASPPPQESTSTQPETQAPVEASKSPSPPKSPFDDPEATTAPAAGSSSPSAATTPPPPVNIATRPSQSSPSPPQDVPAPAGDPRVAGLRAMFPDYDDSILLMVLESVNGNQERAIEALLGMSDPDYKPDTPVTTQAPARPMSQEELDEQLARRLMLEEQEEQQARWYAHQQQQQQQRPWPQRQNSRPPEGQQTSPRPAGSTQASDTMADIQQSLSKAAEVGKKTFGDLFTKVKAKINEFEQGRQSGSGSQGQQSQSQWAGGYDQQYTATGYTQYHHHGSNPPPGAGSGAAASYYDPNAASPVISEQAISPPNRTPAPAVQGYDVSSTGKCDGFKQEEKEPMSKLWFLPFLSRVLLRRRSLTDICNLVHSASPPQVTSSSTSTAPSVPRPSTSPAPIDGGKLGLLPKRPVSLIRDPQPAGARRSIDSDDGLEYAENPFEDQKK